jgi:hypothetical protein
MEAVYDYGFLRSGLTLGALLTPAISPSSCPQGWLFGGRGCPLGMALEAAF